MTPLELAMMASVEEVLTGSKPGSTSTTRPAAPQPGGAAGEQRSRAAHKAEAAALEEERRRREEERQLELEAEAAAAHIGSLRANAVAGHDDGDDDEFGFDPIAITPRPPADTRAHPAEQGGGAGRDRAPAGGAATLAEQSTDASGAEILVAAHERPAADISAAGQTEDPLADLRGSSASALRAVREASVGAGAKGGAAGVAGSGPPAAVHAAKSAAERADELAAAQRRGGLNNISEDAEEEEDEDEDEGGGGLGSGGGSEDKAAAPGAANEALASCGGVDSAAAAEAQRAAAEAAERAAVEAQWAAVERASELATQRAVERAAAPLGARTKGDKIGFAEALSYFESEVDMAPFAAVIVREDWSGASCLPRLVPFLRPKLRGERLHAQRDMLMCVAKVSLDTEHETHDRILMSVFKALTGNTRDPPRFGPHWDIVGFQGTDPATDLRGVGMLGLLNALYLVTRRRELAQSLYALSRGPADFPFMTVCMNVTKICLEALRFGALTGAANQRNSVVEAFHELHCGLYAHMGEQWRARSLTIRDFGHLLKELQELGTKRTAVALRKMKELDEKRAKADLSDGQKLDIGGV